MDQIPAEILVLAVDDDAEFCRIITHYLTEDPRYRVITAGSGRDALQIMNETPVSAIIADYQMPEMDGLDLLRIIRAQGNDIPFIIFTGQGCESVAIQALNEGADFYLVKGEDPGPQFLVLCKNLGEIVAKRQADEALKISEAENRRMLSLLKTTVDELAAANKKLNLLSDVTRHDILNQVHAIFNYLDLAENESNSDACNQYLKGIEDATTVIHRQIQFTKSYQDLGINAPEWQNLSTIIGGLKKSPGITIINETKKFCIHADPLLPKVFENLLDNSVRHGNGTTKIQVTTTPGDDGEIVITWSDNGKGVPQLDKEKIFEKGHGKNTGFGLFLIREILALTGITIRETGKDGSGACFELYVPKGSIRKIP